MNTDDPLAEYGPPILPRPYQLMKEIGDAIARVVGDDFHFCIDVYVPHHFNPQKTLGTKQCQFTIEHVDRLTFRQAHHG